VKISWNKINENIDNNKIKYIVEKRKENEIAFEKIYEGNNDSFSTENYNKNTFNEFRICVSYDGIRSEYNNIKKPRMMPPYGIRPQQAMINMPHQQVETQKMDPSARADYYGEQLFTKISRTPAFANYANYFSKIVGIFLDLDDAVIEKLLKDDKYFHQQVQETIKLLLKFLSEKEKST